MPKQTWIQECAACHKPFSVSGGRTGPMIDWEDIICPHCGAKCGGDRIADVFHTEKLTPEQEREYKRGKKR